MFATFSLNLRKFLSVNLCVNALLSPLRIRVWPEKYAKTDRSSDKSFRTTPFKTFCERLFVNILSVRFAEEEVRRIGLEMRGMNANENKVSINS